MMMINASELAVASWGNLVPEETRQSLWAAMMAMAAVVAFLVSSLNLSSIANCRGRRRTKIVNNLAMKKSTIDGNQ